MPNTPRPRCTLKSLPLGPPPRTVLYMGRALHLYTKLHLQTAPEARCSPHEMKSKELRRFQRLEHTLPTFSHANRAPRPAPSFTCIGDTVAANRGQTSAHRADTASCEAKGCRGDRDHPWMQHRCASGQRRKKLTKRTERHTLRWAGDSTSTVCCCTSNGWNHGCQEFRSGLISKASRKTCARTSALRQRSFHQERRGTLPLRVRRKRNVVCMEVNSASPVRRK